MRGRIGASMRENVMRVKVGTINKTAIDRFGIASAVVFKWRFTEVSGK